MSTYLDYNATAPLLPEAVEAMTAALAGIHNPSSIHFHGREARRIVDSSRRKLADILRVRPEQVIFTASGTEANNMVLRGAPVDVRLVSAIEHPSAMNACSKIELIDVAKEGAVALSSLEALLKQHEGKRCLVSLMQANNETGVIQPVAEAAKLARQYGALIHSDAAQSFGKIWVDMPMLGIDVLTLSGHKWGAPQGVGVVVVAEHLVIEPLLKGGGQEMRRRAGTENVAAIAGLGAALEKIDWLNVRIRALEAPMRKLEQRLQALSPEVRIFGKQAERLASTLNIAMPGVRNETQLMNFDLEGFAVSSGSACSSGKVEASHVLKSMGVAEEEALSAIRISAGWQTEPTELEAFGDVWEKVFARLGSNVT